MRDAFVQLPGAEPFLGSHTLCIYLRISQHIMESDGSLLCSQEPSNGPYTEPDQLSSCNPILSKIHIHIIIPPTS
jgi:hypothetical protein